MRATAWKLAPFLFGGVVLIGCGQFGSSSACKALDGKYADGGFTRKEYLPCAADILQGFDEVRENMGRGLAGDRGALGRAQSSLDRVHRMMEDAGGRNLLERWNDGMLTSMNVDLFNAYGGYEAVLMPHGLVVMTEELKRVDQQSNETDFRNANRSLESARQLFEMMR